MKWKDEEESNRMEEHHAYTAPITDMYKKIPFPYPTVIIGAGGFGREVAEIARRVYLSFRNIRILGFLDDNKKLHGKKINGKIVMGSIEWLSGEIDLYYVYGIGDPKIKHDLDIKSWTYNNHPINMIDPETHLLHPNIIGKGVVIQAGACIAVNTNIEDHVHINFNCSIGHNVHIGKYSTISPLCALSGFTDIGKCCFLGSGVITFPNVKIGENSKIGAGSVVTKDIPPNVLAIGSPAKVIKRLDNERT